MARKKLKLVAVFILGTMILSEVSYAQVGLAVMGARRAKKRLEEQQQQQIKTEQVKKDKATEQNGVADSNADKVAEKTEAVKGEVE